MMEVLMKLAHVTKTPSDGSGVFELVIDAFDTVDSDDEKVANYTNVSEGDTTEVDVDYGHLAALGPGADPLAQKIGTAKVQREGKQMTGEAKLDLDNRVGAMVYERLLLDSDDPAFLGQVSVWFSYDPSKTKTEDGVRTIVDAELLSIAVIKTGAQRTAIENVKSRAAAAGVTIAPSAYAAALGEDIPEDILKVLMRTDEPTREKNIYETLEGSDEARRDAINHAVGAWAEATYPANADGMRESWTCVVGTYPDRVVVAVESMSADTEYLEIGYTIDAAGEVVLDDPASVDLAVTVQRTAAAEETETPPWHIEKRDDQWCVIADETDEVVKCHDTEQAAKDHLAALYANVPDASESEKAGRVIGAKAAGALKAKITATIDEFVSEINGGGDEKVADPDTVTDPPATKPKGDEKDFARGYGDASMSRPAPDETTEEYDRGYGEGTKDRSKMERSELDSLKTQIDSILL